VESGARRREEGARRTAEVSSETTIDLQQQHHLHGCREALDESEQIRELVSASRARQFPPLPPRPCCPAMRPAPSCGCSMPSTRGRLVAHTMSEQDHRSLYSIFYRYREPTAPGGHRLPPFSIPRTRTPKNERTGDEGAGTVQEGSECDSDQEDPPIRLTWKRSSLRLQERKEEMKKGQRTSEDETVHSQRRTGRSRRGCRELTG